ncbi:MAG: hypothetical protein GF421_01475 [Candidatus Aminicenantes bacterium]|nr:hypothetical protein [Candidatus Aminicenantes bacterium]
MKCQETKNLITIGIYGQLTAGQKQELESHLKECPECSRLYEKSALLMGFSLKEREIPSPDLTKSWEVISEKVLNRRRFPRILPVQKWVLVASSLLIVFILGYFAGKEVLKTQQKGSPLESATPLSLASYADHLNPFLVNFINQDKKETPHRIQRLEKEIIRDILFQTRLLKELASHNGNTERLELLQDMEFILVSMSNLEAGDQKVALHLARMIQEKNISLKLKELITEKSSI